MTHTAAANHRPRAAVRSLCERAIQTLWLEASAVVLTWPLMMLCTPLGWQAALVAEAGLTSAYVAYGYVFHLVFDRLRPVQTAL